MSGHTLFFLSLHLIVGFICNMQAQNTVKHPLMRDFIGINGRGSDPAALMRSFGFVREYHEWADDTGFDPDGLPNCPVLPLRFSPSNSKAAHIDYDSLYRTLSGRVAPCLKGLAPEMLGLRNYDPILLERKPLCDSTLNAAMPEAYLDFTRWVTAYALRYGKNRACNEALGSDFCNFYKHQLEPKNAEYSGFGLIPTLELGNEPDKWWYDDAFRNQPQALYQYMPTQYAALLHAAYDGAGKSAGFRLSGESSSYLGVKNADSTIQVAMGGLSDFRGRYLVETLQAAWNLRANMPGVVHKLPLDVINLHHYCSDVPYTGAEYINNPAIWNAYDYYGLNTRGISPEAAQLKDRCTRFFQKLLESLPDTALRNAVASPGTRFWLSEFGYDTNDNSPIKARLSAGTQSYFTTQAQWLVRSFLELSAVEYHTGNQTMVFDRAAAFDLRDHALPENGLFYYQGGGLFSHSGLMNRRFQPKRAWYYVQTLKNVLGDTRFTQDLNPNGEIKFDNGGVPPRIYYYKGEKGEKILAIWSPTENKTANKFLTLSTTQLINALNDPELTEIKSATLVQMLDHSTAGIRKGFDISGNFIRFNTNTVGISETPIFVVLNQNISDVLPTCPLNVVSRVTRYCHGVLLEWKAGQIPPGKWQVYVAERNNLPNSPYCQSFLNTDLLGNAYVHPYLTDFPASRGRLFIDELKPSTDYVVFLVFIDADGLPARTPFLQCFTTLADVPHVFNPCFTLIPFESQAGPADDYCHLAVQNQVPFFNPGCKSDACSGGNPTALFSCAAMDAETGCGLPFLFPIDELWAGSETREIELDFSEPVLLDGINWYHHSGNAPLDVFYASCAEPHMRKHLFTWQADACNRWIHWVQGLPVEPISRLWFRKSSVGLQSEEPDLKIGKLYFYGKRLGCGDVDTPQASFERDTVSMGTDFLIYPNPAHDVVRIQVSNSVIQTLELMDNQGRILGVYQLMDRELALPALAPGSYFVRGLGASGRIIVKRFAIVP
ncbi:MAG: T9SS type A sorting domain-containing protein [Bacteroidetes bacterium]|nr:T9SS type A sorting domain-containing protein [Bacteroidota bacterium]